MIFAIVAAILAYKKASQNGRNGWLWALAAAGVFIGAQLVVSTGAGFMMGIGVALFGWSESIFDDTLYVGPITVVAVGASILATWLLLRHLDKPIAEPDNSFEPPPPPSFGPNG
ncbi:MAG TPA: hypothetical protein VFZ23_06575 [Pyrinomonadaceae bacterium]